MFVCVCMSYALLIVGLSAMEVVKVMARRGAARSEKNEQERERFEEVRAGIRALLILLIKS